MTPRPIIAVYLAISWAPKDLKKFLLVLQYFSCCYDISYLYLIEFMPLPLPSKVTLWWKICRNFEFATLIGGLVANIEIHRLIKQCIQFLGMLKLTFRLSESSKVTLWWKICRNFEFATLIVGLVVQMLKLKSTGWLSNAEHSWVY